MSERFIFGVDLDGVVADFYAGIRPLAAEWLGVAERTLAPDVEYGLPQWHLDRVGGAKDAYLKFHLWAVTERGLFENLSPIVGAPVVLRQLAHVHDVAIRIITHRLFVKHFHKEAIAQTVKWLDLHDIPYYDICFMSDKAAVGADLYIEDTPRNIEALRASDHPTIVFTNSTNRALPGPRADTWDDVARLVLEEQSKWRHSGQAKKAIAGT